MKESRPIYRFLSSTDASHPRMKPKEIRILLETRYRDSSDPFHADCTPVWRRPNKTRAEAIITYARDPAKTRRIPENASDTLDSDHSRLLNAPTVDPVTVPAGLQQLNREETPVTPNPILDPGDTSVDQPDHALADEILQTVTQRPHVEGGRRASSIARSVENSE
ncbi:hypothetical protein QFC24_005489 [Naganishia onofrii]|uniref:Uncharacterized protein n=1 Tax=Naganishia onofrii TaxID=1851511 RepID=A0ACC2X8Q3_9TREE|nr:hypothetical protein QFC24_005489 [Naganishia onofrii]